MFKYINSILKFLTLDKNEKNFIKRSNKIKKSEQINLEEEDIILQTPLDYYYLLFFTHVPVLLHRTIQKI